MAGALAAIRFARTNRVTFLGTCGGFQHALLEYVRHVLGETRAEHAETNPAAGMPLISPLACSLVEKPGRVLLQKGSRIRRIYGTDEVFETYHCSYGLNRRYQDWLQNDQTLLHFTGHDPEGEIRVLELDKHPFFIATLFQPERSAFKGRPHPLIQSYLQACQPC
jgi:CTP synthase (UTP-ammonia lyase)